MGYVLRASKVALFDLVKYSFILLPSSCLWQRRAQLSRRHYRLGVSCRKVGRFRKSEKK